MKADLEIQIDDAAIQDGALLQCAGRIDYRSCQLLTDALEEVFQLGRYRVIIDLSGVKYVSSSGVGAIVSAAATAEEHSGRIVLLNPAPNVSLVFVLIGLPDLIKVALNLPAAITELSRRVAGNIPTTPEVTQPCCPLSGCPST
ncbi:MAG: STAS domain-containing protein [Planctomycetota bacterium]